MKNNELNNFKLLFFIVIIILISSGCSNQLLLKHILPDIEQYRFNPAQPKVVENIFENKNKDDDNDGIYNSVDKCPHTQPGTLINWVGCPRNSHQSNPLYLIAIQPKKTVVKKIKTRKNQ
ncbi:MAG: hypothetical protein QM504_03000 [Pseudomonadota bacterium]